MSIDYDLVKQWEDAKENLDYYKNIEAKLRRDIADDVKKNSESKNDDGRYYLKVDGDDGSSVKLKATFPTNFSVDDQDELDVVFDDLSDLEKNCFTVKYSVSGSKYKELKRLIDKGDMDESEFDIFTLITEKDGVPKLELMKDEE